MASTRTDDTQTADWYVSITYGRNVSGGTEAEYNDGYMQGDRPTRKEAIAAFPHPEGRGWLPLGSPRIESTKHK